MNDEVVIQGSIKMAIKAQIKLNKNKINNEIFNFFIILLPINLFLLATY